MEDDCPAPRGLCPPGCAGRHQSQVRHFGLTLGRDRGNTEQSPHCQAPARAQGPLFFFRGRHATTRKDPLGLPCPRMARERLSTPLEAQEERKGGQA